MNTHVPVRLPVCHMHANVYLETRIHIYIYINRVIVLEWARRTKYQRDVFTKNHVFGRYFWTFLCLVELDNDLFRCRGVNLVKK